MYSCRFSLFCYLVIRYVNRQVEITALYWLVYSCCSHLEHRASVKRFVSLQFLNLRHLVALLERVISPSQGRYLTQTQNKHKQTSMLRVGFEPTIPAFERAKTFHVLDRAATVVGYCSVLLSLKTSFKVIQ
jgi:FAD synthase